MASAQELRAQLMKRVAAHFETGGGAHRFVDAAEVFAPQKGATSAQVELLTRRLERLAEVYLEDYGVDVRDLEGGGAAGGLAGLHLRPTIRFA
jgi:glycerate kinase